MDMRALYPIHDVHALAVVQQDDCLQAFIECQYKDGSYLSDDSVRACVIKDA